MTHKKPIRDWQEGDAKRPKIRKKITASVVMFAIFYGIVSIAIVSTLQRSYGNAAGLPLLFLLLALFHVVLNMLSPRSDQSDESR